MSKHHEFEPSDVLSGLMDGIYRHQKHIYDFTRKYYLLGRDGMINNLDVQGSQTVLEIGCGTGRNLVVAGKRWPEAQLFGFDISSEMLATARNNCASKLPERKMRLVQADACKFVPANQFGMSGFDRVFVSYSLSMIPDWKSAAEQAMSAVTPGGELHIVDFGDQSGLPAWFRSLLRRWLAMFHVAPRQDMSDFLADLAHRHNATFAFKSLYRGYAWSAVIRKVSAI